MKFYKCSVCGEIIYSLKEISTSLTCCDKEMKEIIPGKVEASLEKHIPVVKENKNSIDIFVGSIIHPMEETHLIEWIAVETTNNQVYFQYLKANQEPKATFNINIKNVKNVYSYCNTHGLWYLKLN